MYQYYADMVQQRRMQGTSGSEEIPDAAGIAAQSSYAATAQQVELRQDAQAQEVAPSMEVGDRAEREKGTAAFAPPGGRNSDASELLRLLGANTEGTNAAASPDGTSSNRTSFWNEILKSFSDSGAHESAMASGTGNDFNSYMNTLLQKTYGA